MRTAGISLAVQDGVSRNKGAGTILAKWVMRTYSVVSQRLPEQLVERMWTNQPPRWFDSNFEFGGAPIYREAILAAPEILND